MNIELDSRVRLAQQRFGDELLYIYIKVLNWELEYITATEIHFLLSRALFNCVISLIGHLCTVLQIIYVVYCAYCIYFQNKLYHTIKINIERSSSVYTSEVVSTVRSLWYFGWWWFVENEHIVEESRLTVPTLWSWTFRWPRMKSRYGVPLIHSMSLNKTKVDKSIFKQYNSHIFYSRDVE